MIAIWLKGVPGTSGRLIPIAGSVTNATQVSYDDTKVIPMISTDANNVDVALFDLANVYPNAQCGRGWFHSAL